MWSFTKVLSKGNLIVVLKYEVQNDWPVFILLKIVMFSLNDFSFMCSGFTSSWKLAFIKLLSLCSRVICDLPLSLEVYFVLMSTFGCRRICVTTSWPVTLCSWARAVLSPRQDTAPRARMLRCGTLCCPRRRLSLHVITSSSSYIQNKPLLPL